VKPAYRKVTPAPDSESSLDRLVIAATNRIAFTQNAKEPGIAAGLSPRSRGFATS